MRLWPLIPAIAAAVMEGRCADCAWSSMAPGYLEGCSTDCASFATLTKAQEACLSEDTCGGLMMVRQSGKIQLRAGDTLKTEGATSPQEADASSSVCEQVPWYLVACENPGHESLQSCTLPTTGSCFGRVKLGYGEHWSEWRYVQGEFNCSNAFFGGDPWDKQAKECVCEELVSDSSSVKATDLTEMCGKRCREEGYCCNDPQIGSNQMISCTQACEMRNNGMALDKMLSENSGLCDRNGQSGCTLSDGIADYKFCMRCEDLTERCPHGVQSAEECDFGARAYGEAGVGIETKEECFRQVLKIYSAETCPMIVWSSSKGVTCDCRYRCMLYETVEGEVWETYSFQEVEALSRAGWLPWVVAGASIAFLTGTFGFLWRLRQQKSRQPPAAAATGASEPPRSGGLAGGEVAAPELTRPEAQPTEAEELPMASAVPVCP